MNPRPFQDARPVPDLRPFRHAAPLRHVRALSAVALSATLAGCALPPLGPFGPSEPAAPGGTVYRIDTPYDKTLAARLLANGPNTVTGSASVRQRNGTVVTCAGQSVYLVPATDYARIRVRALYGSDERGASLDGRSYRFDPDPPEYSKLVRQAQCDANGRFRFDRVASGSFFLTAVVRWQEGERRAGGSLMQQVTTGGGRTVNLTLSR
jgi:hypothetical protein